MIKNIDVEYIQKNNNVYYIGNLNIDVDEKELFKNRFIYFNNLENKLSKYKITGIPSNASKSGWHETKIMVNNLEIIWYSNFDFEYRLEDKHAIVEIKFNSKLLKSHYNVFTTNHFVDILNFYEKGEKVIALLYNTMGSDFFYNLLINEGLSPKLIEALNSYAITN
jgi:hypothetical protein